jgi:hypothetical protein
MLSQVSYARSNYPQVREYLGEAYVIKVDCELSIVDDRGALR